MSQQRNNRRSSVRNDGGGRREDGGFKPLGLRAVAAAARSVNPPRATDGNGSQLTDGGPAATGRDDSPAA
jgi:hypothetical protein